MATKTGKRAKRTTKLRLQDDIMLKLKEKYQLKTFVAFLTPTVEMNDEGCPIAGQKESHHYYNSRAAYNIYKGQSPVSYNPEECPWNGQEFPLECNKIGLVYYENGKKQYIEYTKTEVEAIHAMTENKLNQELTPAESRARQVYYAFKSYRVGHDGNTVISPDNYAEIIEMSKKMETHNKKLSRCNIKVEEVAAKRYSTTLHGGTFSYIDYHPENKNGIIIYRLRSSVTWAEGASTPDIDLETVSYCEIIPGIENSKVYNVRKTGDFESVREDILNIKNDAIVFDKILEQKGSMQNRYSNYMDRQDLLAFFEAFPNFVKRTGFDVASMLASGWNAGDYFTKYCYLIAEFPVIEQLVKMSYWRLISDIIKSLDAPKKDRKKVCEDITEIINADATSGKKGLRLSSWIASYVNDQMLSYRDAVSWVHLNEIHPFTKEAFEGFVKSSDFKLASMINRGLIEELANIAVYGYDPVKTVSYARKQATVYGRTVQESLRDLFDYARMCDVMGIQPDLYPKDIHDVHDKMATSYRAYQDRELDNNIAKVKKSLMAPLTAIKKTKAYEDGDYEIIIPENSLEIIDEGQQQRNCVGSYVRSVAEGRSTIFFVRKKESPEKSLVTVEYAHGHMTQCYYAGNRYVNRDSREAKLAQSFCNEITKHAANKEKRAAEKAANVPA